MSDTSAQAQTSSAVKARGRLLRMLQSMSQRWPRTYLQRTADGFGVHLDGGSFLRIVYNGQWSDEDMRDFLALFATWLSEDPEYLREKGIRLDGALSVARSRSEQLLGPPPWGAAEGHSTRHSA